MPMAELLRGASESYQGDQRGKVTIDDAERASCPGEIPETKDAEQAVVAKVNERVDCTVWNDLRVSAELELGQGSGWQVIYPEASLKLAGHSVENLEVSVRLRDDVNVCGVCTPVHCSTLRLSRDFGDFGDQATKRIQAEEKAAAQEIFLRERRQKEINQQLNEEVSRAVRWRQKWAMILFWLCVLILLGAMVACTVVAFSLGTELKGIGLALALLGLCCCAGSGVGGLFAAIGGSQDMRPAVQAARPDLQGFEDSGVKVQSGAKDWRIRMLSSSTCCFPVVVLSCVVAMTVASGLNGHGWASAVLWGSVALMMCCGGVGGWMTAAEGAGWRQRAGKAFAAALFSPFVWPLQLLVLCGFGKRFAALLLKPAKRSLDAAVHTTHEHTIVFEGNVLPGRETVCSWPGKYATAWDMLVAGSKQDDISAAVVFLPQGSKDFGLHDRIPASQDLQDVHGDCWCTPLYGESKPWGCRWWSKWIANIEQAASQQCTLEVYYFNGMRGKGKVKDFTTAGEEHMRREAIERRRDAFLKSEGFSIALEAGLKHLPKEKGPDSSSPYSREVHRLFLAWLPEEDRQFLVLSEGIGNSQKAEVAWLERKGYSYIEKEVRELESSSPKAIGRAVTP